MTDLVAIIESARQHSRKHGKDTVAFGDALCARIVEALREAEQTPIATSVQMAIDWIESRIAAGVYVGEDRHAMRIVLDSLAAWRATGQPPQRLTLVPPANATTRKDTP